ncbi:MAG: TetR/AcrR family transcriptional regulator [Phycisphaerales bacterium]|nr:TetR/AcrR family transcriptional regulator [Phycisphaerales bacterium]MCI0631058.1 TetR/AcrR family transcriptional regulator [Phycisphaerales bacterium]MCI0674287.1 TetR/AcrR family transcriptional regulator [Phycisphaerales bacterium]
MVRMRSADRRRQLLEVAADLFARLGYRGTTTAELAKSAGITEPILYRHFDNKLDLFVTLVDEVGREVIAGWQDALEGVKDPLKRLEIMLANNPATHEKGRGVYRVIFQAMTEVEGDADIARTLRKHLTRLHQFIKDELAELQRSGAVRKDESANDLAWLLINVAVGYGMTSPMGIGGSVGVGGRKSGMERLITDLVTA